MQVNIRLKGANEQGKWQKYWYHMYIRTYHCRPWFFLSLSSTILTKIVSTSWKKTSTVTGLPSKIAYYLLNKNNTLQYSVLKLLYIES